MAPRLTRKSVAKINSWRVQWARVEKWWLILLNTMVCFLSTTGNNCKLKLEKTWNVVALAFALKLSQTMDLKQTHHLAALCSFHLVQFQNRHNLRFPVSIMIISIRSMLTCIQKVSFYILFYFFNSKDSCNVMSFIYSSSPNDDEWQTVHFMGSRL